MSELHRTFRSAFLLIGCGVVFAGNISAGPVSVVDVLDNNHSAVRPDAPPGGVRNTEKVLQISEGGAVLLARYRATSQGHMRIDVFADGARVYSEGMDSDGAWEWPGGQDGPEDVHHEGAGALAHGIEFNLFTLAELTLRGHAVELADREWIGDKDYFVLKVTLSDGFETWRFVNAETWLVDLSRDFRAFHPGVDATKKALETQSDQWVHADGVKFASRSRTIEIETGAVLATTIVLSSRYNAPVAELDLSRDFVPDEAPTAGNKLRHRQ